MSTYNKMTPSGRMPEYRQLRPSAAELKFHEICESTRQLSRHSRGSEQGELSSAGSSRNRRAAGSQGDEFDSDQNQGEQTGDKHSSSRRFQTGGERKDLTGNLGANLNINFNVHDILMSKFGVSLNGS